MLLDCQQYYVDISNRIPEIAVEMKAITGNEINGVKTHLIWTFLSKINKYHNPASTGIVLKDSER